MTFIHFVVRGRERSNAVAPNVCHLIRLLAENFLALVWSGSVADKLRCERAKWTSFLREKRKVFENGEKPDRQEFEKMNLIG